ncbi:MAG TPA: hypothetical protein VF476_07825 [Chitinophagaceae bacterium]
MNLRETILAKHSKEQTNTIVKWIGDDQKRFDELFGLFMSKDALLEQRAAWPLSYAVMAHPLLIHKHFAKLIKKLKQPGIHDAVKRNGVRLMEVINIPEKFHGDVMSLCFDFITDPKEKPAIKAFSLTVLQNLAWQYPDIKNELKLVIESQWENESAAFRSRAKKILRSLSL